MIGRVCVNNPVLMGESKTYARPLFDDCRSSGITVKVHLKHKFHMRLRLLRGPCLKFEYRLAGTVWPELVYSYEVTKITTEPHYQLQEKRAPWVY